MLPLADWSLTSLKYALMSMFPLAVFRLNCSADTSPTSTPPLEVFILSFSNVLSGRYTVIT